jgi:hypothetical protein
MNNKRKMKKKKQKTKNRSVCAYGNHPCHGHGAVDKWTKDALFARCY